MYYYIIISRLVASLINLCEARMPVKKCKICNKIKSANDFYKQTVSIDGLQRKCKVCDKKQKKEWSVLNKERELIKCKEYRDSHKKERAIIISKWAKENPEKRKAIRERHRLINKDKDAAKSAQRRAAKLQATPIWANHYYIKLFYKGAKIEAQRTDRKVHVDHIIPLKGKNVCGLHVEDNLQLMFAEDNISKGNSHAD